MKTETVSRKLKEKQGIFIDVRTPAEFESMHVHGVQNTPLDQLKKNRLIQEMEKDEELIIFCQSGSRAGIAQKDLVALGFTNTSVVEGGVVQWEKEGLPVVKGKQSISLERQVRITAGAMVFIGTVLGLSVHSGFFGIPAFVGAGLMFAGLTDTCAMGILISKMPWNSVTPAYKVN